jgi:probable addiction module antidote protein
MTDPIETTAWDITEHLQDDAAVADSLATVFEDGDLAEIRRALAHVARARGMGELAQRAGLSRSGLYKALGEGGNPSFETVAGLLKALGVRLTVGPTQA